MNSTTLKQQFQSICSQFADLQNENMTLEEMEVSLFKMNTALIVLINRVMSQSTLLNEELRRRNEWNVAVDLTIMKAEAKRSFLNDQMRFYKEWMLKFELGFLQTNDRCSIGLTVKQLVLVLRLAKDIELIKSKQLKPYFLFLQAHFRTEMQDILSYESLRKKYSQLDKATMKKVKSKLEQMLQKLKEYMAKLE